MINKEPPIIKSFTVHAQAHTLIDQYIYNSKMHSCCGRVVTVANLPRRWYDQARRCGFEYPSMKMVSFEHTSAPLSIAYGP